MFIAVAALSVGLSVNPVIAQGTAPVMAPSPATEVTNLPLGMATQTLLERQRSGVQASATPRPVPGEVAARSYKRYLDSFERPIPDNFKSVVSTSK